MSAFLRILFAPFRAVASFVILGYDRMFKPIAVSRSPESQAQVDRETAQLALYHFEACPFCVKVRREIGRLGLKVEMRDVKLNPQFKKELVAEGGQFQVPCLRIQDGPQARWMYESSDINAYLSERFGRV